MSLRPNGAPHCNSTELRNWSQGGLGADDSGELQVLLPPNLWDSAEAKAAAATHPALLLRGSSSSSTGTVNHGQTGPTPHPQRLPSLPRGGNEERRKVPAL